MKPGKRTFLKACFTACLSLAVLLGAYGVRTISVTPMGSSPSARILPGDRAREAAETPPPALELDFQGTPFYIDCSASEEEDVWRAFQWPDGPIGENRRLRYRYNYDYGYSPIELFSDTYPECPILHDAIRRDPSDRSLDMEGWNKTFAKPVIYLYPEAETEVTVRLEYKGRLTCTYPAPDPDGAWHVTARPDGTLTDRQGREYSYLFWEGASDGTPPDFSRGFVVRGSDTAAFLREKLAYMGLTPREYNEFIVYWLPRMQDNPWNLIAFQGRNYTDSAPLTVTPRPDSILRVFMAYHPLNAPVSVPLQELTPFVRRGFTLVEWGGQGPDGAVR